MTTSQAQEIKLIAAKQFRDTGLGHGSDHLLRVTSMALQFCSDDADPNLITAIAMLHDADDYKLVGKNVDPDLLPNATDIMNTVDIPKPDQEFVKACIRTIGYSKRIAGTVPTSPEAKAVSDADMCDIMGVDGLIRLAEWRGGRMSDVFDPDKMPDPDKSPEDYRTARGNTIVEHMFEKVMKLPALMLTDQGRIEAYLRLQFNIQFLTELFRERHDAKWHNYLQDYLRKYPC